MDREEAIQYLIDNMNEDSILIGVTPETILNETIDVKIIQSCKILDLCLCPNGTVYSKNKQGFMGQITDNMYNDRKKYKDEMILSKKKYEVSGEKNDEYDVVKFHNLQLAKKIMLNSLYGSLSNEYCRWFNFYHAEAITKSGQTYIRYIDKKINGYLNKILETNGVDYIIASDTDSVYVDMENVVKKMNIKDYDNNIEKEKIIVKHLDDFCENYLQKFINKQFNNLSDMLNVYSHRTEMKRETIANKGIWKAKKMYILNAWNIEGVQFDKPKLKIQGIEAVRSSTPYVCRQYIKKSLEIIMNETEKDLQNYIVSIKKDYRKLPFDDIAFPRGVSDVDKYIDNSTIYTWKTPVHVKASILYNHAIKKYKFNNLKPISNGDKIKWCYLIRPNIFNDDEVIANLDTFPVELDVLKYIDYERQFEKSFIIPLRNITDTINWKLERKNTIERFFS